MRDTFARAKKAMMQEIKPGEIEKVISDATEAAENSILDLGCLERLIMMDAALMAMELRMIKKLMSDKSLLTIAEQFKVLDLLRQSTYNLTRLALAAAKLAGDRPELVPEIRHKNAPPDFSQGLESNTP